MTVTGQDGYELVPLQPGPPALSRGPSLLRRRSEQPSRRAVLHLQAGRDVPPPDDLAAWFTERGFHFYIAPVRWPRARPGRAGRRALAAALTDLDGRCQHLRTAEGIGNVIVTAHGEGAEAAARWCAAPLPGTRPDALVLYAPSFGRAVRRGLDIACPVLVIGGTARGRRLALRPAPAAAAARPGAAGTHLGRHVTWLLPSDGGPSDGDARPDAGDSRERGRFFDELGRWLGAYMYGQARDHLL